MKKAKTYSGSKYKLLRKKVQSRKRLKNHASVLEEQKSFTKDDINRP
ncbi:MAG: hypothetical protein Q4B14_03710 [Clostridia bacterium]|nr:hypothetical protein [Clostridia bacterium]